MTRPVFSLGNIIYLEETTNAKNRRIEIKHRLFNILNKECPCVDWLFRETKTSPVTHTVIPDR